MARITLGRVLSYLTDSVISVLKAGAKGSTSSAEVTSTSIDVDHQALDVVVKSSIDVSNFPSSIDVSNFPASQAVTGSVDITDRSAREVGRVRDRYGGGEILEDQSGGGVRTFTFSTPVQLVWVRVDGSDGRADPFGGTPAVDTGIFCEDGLPNPITVQTSSVKVYAATGTIRVWGFRE